MSRVPDLSVVMPVRNEKAHLGAVVRQLLDQNLDFERYEILVVDGQSNDGTRDVIRELQAEAPNLFILNNPNCLASSARNIGARAARGRFVLFVDGHCRIPHNDMLQKVLEAFENGEKCVSRPQPLLAGDQGGFAEAVSLARKSIIGHNAGSKIYQAEDYRCNPLTAGCGYELELFWKLGGIDENFDAAEDLEFNFRVKQASIEAMHSEKFTIEYFPRQCPTGLFRQLYRYGYGRARMTHKHANTFSPLSAMLGLLVVCLVTLPVLGFFWEVAWWLFLPLFATYAAGTACAALWAARGRNPLTWIKTWYAFPVIHFGAGLGYLLGLMKGPDWRHSNCEPLAEE